VEYTARDKQWCRISLIGYFWIIWKGRNQCKYDSIQPYVENLIGAHYEFMHLTKAAHAAQRLLSSSIPIVKIVVWERRHNENYVLNVDGSSCGLLQRRAGVGGILRRGDGTFVHAFSNHIGMFDHHQAELEAIIF
jgi:hypothetical protein